MGKYVNVKFDGYYVEKMDYIKSTFNVTAAKLTRFLFNNQMTLNELWQIAKEHNEKFNTPNYEFLIKKGLHFE